MGVSIALNLTCFVLKKAEPFMTNTGHCYKISIGTHSSGSVSVTPNTSRPIRVPILLGNRDLIRIMDTAAHTAIAKAE